jgi:hypothetical protein
MPPGQLMLIALEINVALWGVILWVTVEVTQRSY